MTILAMLLVIALGPAPALALTTSEEVAVSPNNPTSMQLVSEPKKWDGREITFTGEAIAEAMQRGDYAWVHLNDDAYYLKNIEEGARLGGYNSGHAVWLSRTLAEKIERYGDYRNQGDVVTIRGVFNAACAEHGGDMDIHAESLQVKVQGRSVTEPIKSIKLAISTVLLAIAAVLWLGTRRRTHLEAFGALSSWWR